MRSPLAMRVHGLVEHSYVNGPGMRTVVWTQGCTIRCPGCFNPAAQTVEGGHGVPIPELLRWIMSVPGIEGVTISGGEPLDQPEPLAMLLREIRRCSSLSIVLFTGRTWETISTNREMFAAVWLSDVVVAGPFDERRILGQGLRGSANQTIHLMTDRYSWSDIEEVPGLEIIIGGRKTVVTGVIDADIN
jgi:anaerobic ribonucleoside-triphosphate reductase activating protein